MSEIQMALAAAVIAVIYGALVSKSILSLPAGNKKMKILQTPSKKVRLRTCHVNTKQSLLLVLF